MPDARVFRADRNHDRHVLEQSYIQIELSRELLNKPIDTFAGRQTMEIVQWAQDY